MNAEIEGLGRLAEDDATLGIEVPDDLPPLDHIYPFRPGDPVAAGTVALCGHVNTDDGHVSAALSHPRMCGLCLGRFYKRLHGEEAF